MQRQRRRADLGVRRAARILHLVAHRQAAQRGGRVQDRGPGARIRRIAGNRQRLVLAIRPPDIRLGFRDQTKAIHPDKANAGLIERGCDSLVLGLRGKGGAGKGDIAPEGLDLQPVNPLFANGGRCAVTNVRLYLSRRHEGADDIDKAKRQQSSVPTRGFMRHDRPRKTT